MSWPTISTGANLALRRCVAFPCEPSALSSAVAAVRSFCRVKEVHYWRERCYCLVEVDSAASLQSLLKKHRSLNLPKRYHFRTPVFHLLKSAPQDPKAFDDPSVQPRFKTIEVSEAPAGDAMAQRLADFRSLSAQILALESALRPDRSDLLLRKLYIQSVEAFLTALLPDTRVHVFGSLVSGLWTKSGDVDITVSFGQRTRAPNDYLKNVFLNYSSENKLLVLKNLIRMTDNSYTFLKAILNTRAPILRAIHASRLSIDFSVWNETSLALQRTSHLLKAILETSMCPELRPLALFLKWHLRHCKSFHVGDRLSGFKLTMLVIFFLQERRLLPPLQPLMDDLAAGRLPQVAARPLQAELLGALFRELLTFLVDLCEQKDLFFDIRTGRRGRCEDNLHFPSVFVCPEPNLPELDVMNLDSGTVARLGKSCARLADALRGGNSYQPALLKKGTL